MLTDTACKQAKPDDGKARKIYDSAGLHLLINTSGSKYWRLDYRINNKRKTLALGVYPIVTLKDARDKTLDAKRLIDKGIDPSEQKRESKQSKINDSLNTFEAIALEWGSKKMKGFDEPKHHYRRMLERDIFPIIGNKPIDSLKAIDILSVLRRVEERGHHNLSHRLLMLCGLVMRYSVQTSRIEKDCTADLRGALTKGIVKSFPTITDPVELGELLRRIDKYEGCIQVCSALKLSSLLFVRPVELREAEWSQFDFDKREWRYYVTKTKSNHIVPLSSQAMNILTELYSFSGQGKFIFPSHHYKGIEQCIGSSTLNNALRTLGYGKDDMSLHGFRATARTILDEILEYPIHLIEHQLCHKVKDVNGTSYNRTTHLEQRRGMMQEYSTYLENLKMDNSK